MKMCFLFSGIFWGSFLVLLGIAIVLKAVFNINVPVFRLFFAFLFIYIGVRLLLGSCWPRRGPECAMFQSTRMRSTAGDRDFTAVFGRGNLDLTDVKVEEETVTVSATAVFGALAIKVDPKMPILVDSNSVFANMRMPDGQNHSFGQRVFRNSAYSEGKPHLKIKANAVFADLSISE